MRWQEKSPKLGNYFRFFMPYTKDKTAPQLAAGFYTKDNLVSQLV